MFVMSCYNVTETEGGRLFDGAFTPSLFAIDFEVDNTDETSPSGWILFEPRKRLATMYYYGHPEDMSPTIEDFDLYKSHEGSEVLAAFDNFSLDLLYVTAKEFTEKTVTEYRSEVERYWQEYLASRN